MHILDRHFIKEFLKPLVACLLAFLLCMLVYDLYDNLDDFFRAKTSLGKIFNYYLILIPAWIVEIMPITLLLALLYVLSDMSKHGELTAMRAGGLDFFRLMRSYFAIGICISMLMLFISLVWAPNALYKAKVIFEKSTQKPNDSPAKMSGVMYRDIPGNRFWVIDILDPVTRRATGIEITQYDEKQRGPCKRFSAVQGEYEDGHWIFQNVIIYNYTLPDFDPGSLQRVPVLDVREWIESPKQFVAAAKFRKTKRISTSELWENLRYTSRLSPRHRALFSTELHSRMAFPMANLIVFLIGVPFGVVGQRRSGFLAIVNSLLFFFAYFLAMKTMLVFGENGRVPGWFAAWSPNILFTAIGIFMIRKIR